jgi:Domain of unknown function (DUF4160)
MTAWTCVREKGSIYTSDHPLPHVHTEKAGAIMKIDLATSQVTEIVGTIADRDVMRAERLVAKHSLFLNAEWIRIHGNQRTDRKGS